MKKNVKKFQMLNNFLPKHEVSSLVKLSDPTFFYSLAAKMFADATCENMRKFIKDETERCKASIPIERMIDWTQLMMNARRKKPISNKVKKRSNNSIVE